MLGIYLVESSKDLPLLLLQYRMQRYICLMNLQVILMSNRGSKLPKLSDLCSGPTGLTSSFLFFVSIALCFVLRTWVTMIMSSFQLCNCGGAWSQCPGLFIWLHLLLVRETGCIWSGNSSLLCERRYQYILVWVCSYRKSTIPGWIFNLQGIFLISKHLLPFILHFFLFVIKFVAFPRLLRLHRRMLRRFKHMHDTNTQPWVKLREILNFVSLRVNLLTLRLL